MAVVEWTTDVKVGVALIDHEHHKLIVRLNKMQAAIGAGARDDQSAEMFHAFLIAFEESVDKENDLIDHTGYPRCTEHFAAHETLAAHMLNLDWQAVSGKARIDLTALQHVAALLVDHIKGPDREFATFYLSTHKSSLG